jgi:hypothetical protein
MKLSVKQKKDQVVNVYAVKVTVYVHHQSEAEAQAYVLGALEDWNGGSGRMIPAYHCHSVEESPIRFPLDVIYPEEWKPE